MVSKPPQRSAKLAPRYSLASAMVLTLIGFAGRTYALNAKELRGDESFAAAFSDRPLSAIWHSLATTEPHPPGYYFPLHFWIQAAGPWNYSLRYLSVVASVVCIPALWICLRRVAGDVPAFTGALLAAINPLLIWQAQDARMYAQVEGFSALLLAGAALVLADPTSRLGSRILIFSSVGAVLTHFYGLLDVGGVVAGLFAVATFFPALRRAVLITGVGALVSALIFWIPLVIHSAVPLRNHFPFPALTPWQLMFSLWRTSIGGLTLPHSWSIVAAISGLTISLVGLGAMARRNPPFVLVLSGALFGPYAGLALEELVRPGFMAPYSAIIVCPVLVSWASIAASPARWARLAVVAALAGAGTLSVVSLRVYATQTKNAPFRYAAHQLLLHAPADIHILTNYPDPTLFWVYSRQLKGALPITLVPPRGHRSKTQLETAMQKRSAHSAQLWFWTLGGTNPWDPRHLAQWWLQTYTLDVGRVDYHGVGFAIYETPYGFLQHAPRLPSRSFAGHIEALAVMPV
ncbi:MAG: hypothetical protein M1396_04740, partial [Chloroflexi bacterium]|nr:hypothetical protein [Chloroflexota bacterium]